MSKAKLIITAVVVEGRTQAEVAASYGVCPGWVSRLLTCYRAQGRPRSRRPRSSPTAVQGEVVDLIVRLRKELTDAGLDAGAAAIDLAATGHL